MVLFKSMGGLGNQLFQYATARRLGAALGVGVGADTSWHERRLRNTTPRPFVLPELCVRLEQLPPGTAFGLEWRAIGSSGGYRWAFRGT